MNIFKEIFLKSKSSKKKILLDKNYTYSDLYNLTDEYLSFFKLNLKSREIISVISDYSIDFIAIILSARINGNILCILNPNSTDFEKKNILYQSNYSMVITDRKIIKTSKKFKNIFYKKRKKHKKLNKDDAFIVFTSGTTSYPKGAILTNKSIENNVKGIIHQLKFISRDRTIIYTPPNYAMGISQIITFTYLKCSFVFDNNGIKFANDFLDKIRKYKITILNLNLASFKYLRFYKNKYISPFLKIVMCGGMKMHPDDAKEIFNFFDNKYLVNFYGCTENSPRISHFKITKKQLKRFRDLKLLPVGQLLKGTKIFIKKLKKNDKKDFGEIYLKGNSLMRCYLNSKNFQKKIVSYNTKDIGFFSSNYLFVIGRSDNIFKSGNEKISPEEVEDKIRPYIKNRTFIIIKKKHQILNWQPVLVIEGKEIKSDKTLLDNLNKKISNFKVPKDILYLNKLDRNSYGKIDRKKIFENVSNYEN